MEGCIGGTALFPGLFRGGALLLGLFWFSGNSDVGVWVSAVWVGCRSVQASVGTMAAAGVGAAAAAVNAENVEIVSAVSVAPEASCETRSMICMLSRRWSSCDGNKVTQKHSNSKSVESAQRGCVWCLLLQDRAAVVHQHDRVLNRSVCVGMVMFE